MKFQAAFYKHWSRTKESAIYIIERIPVIKIVQDLDYNNQPLIYQGMKHLALKQRLHLYGVALSFSFLFFQLIIWGSELYILYKIMLKAVLI